MNIESDLDQKYSDICLLLRWAQLKQVARTQMEVVLVMHNHLGVISCRSSNRERSMACIEDKVYVLEKSFFS